MARVRMFGAEFAADLIEQLADGTWKAIARAHTGRTRPGTTIICKQSEIIEGAAAEMPAPSPTAGLADLERGMAEERKTLPPVSELLAAHQASLPPDPTRPKGRQMQEHRK